MKKNKVKRLTLNRETLLQLESRKVNKALGGAESNGCPVSFDCPATFTCQCHTDVCDTWWDCTWWWCVE
jgi:hypothetical protein